ncbi:uncharacterized 2Fe-2S/4Fe-4S cluster protein (DUF4445 family) [Rhodobium orientis]|uniref:Drug:proton antiporter n=1 Tax=Rhodobium orientis TaxID=34017 RepID=A0A327JJH2_9HYPH|nr:ASKHA domain-containing protein [Rhodobium orientis]MBB4302393.1 uncharacterized 2Fe-2S/4Fe-4S cluster protein (DUF4445 family) [Rhodobium orientis]MBK5949097.1 drug:proton antiporter [Rhodobium orientis]RAI26580.1 drug:proton antiporter [Rhodobium orientis]
MADERPPESETARVVFLPSGRRGTFAHGTTLLDAARSLGVYLESACGGRAICGRCQLMPVFGSFAKHNIDSKPDNITAFGDVEARFKTDFGLKADRRLGCQTRILGDMVVDVPPDSEMHRQVVRKRAEGRKLPLNPATKLYTVAVDEPDMHHPSGDLERLTRALEQRFEVKVERCAPAVLRALQKTLRAGEWRITVAVRDDGRMPAMIVAAWPGSHDKLLGIAVDIGSTTIACHLMNLNRGRTLTSSGIMNPQIRFGEDLMSRVSYIMMNPDSLPDLVGAVREAIDALVGKVVADVGAERSDVLEAVFVGNPVMHHLLLGIDPTELGGAPFALATSGAQTLAASDLDLELGEGASVYTLPCIAGHVGADAAAVILSEKPYKDDLLTLIVDVGTNAEIVLGNSERVLACSSPTGPAFEGAELTSGQRAAPGAIERVRIDAATLEPRFKVIGCDLWSNEDGFEEAVAVTGVTGICGSGIIEAIGEMFLAGLLTTDGIIDGAKAAISPRVVGDGRTFSYVMRDGPPALRITQNDIRAIQLAKAALRAGIQLLMDRLGAASVDRIRLAGAFGSHIDVKYAMLLGMIPDCDLDKVTSIGNAAGTGAQMALLDTRARAEIEDVVTRIEKVETAVEPAFQEHFVAAMAIPHKTDPYARLASKVPLPERTVSADTGGERRRRRRRGNPQEQTGETQPGDT